MEYTKEKLFVIIAFLASLSFTLYGMLPTLVTGDFTALNTLSIIMSIFGFIGTFFSLSSFGQLDLAFCLTGWVDKKLSSMLWQTDYHSLLNNDK